MSENSFLSAVAQRFAVEHQNDIESLTFVFPNRRAGLFFRRYLAQAFGHPILSPKIITVNQLFESLSEKRIADSIDLQFRLHRIYCSILHRDESLDDFLFWGRMMLSDFNEVDMHLADAKQLFTNLADIKNIDLLFEHLGDEQRDSLRRFLRGFAEGQDNHYRQRFLTMWQALYAIYDALRQSLQHTGEAYMGMLCREVIEHKDEWLNTISSDYVFIGFNALTGVERTLMQLLQSIGRADFYWDYHSLFLSDPDNRASLFMKSNIETFPSKYELSLPASEIPEIHWLCIPSFSGQALLINKILSDINSTDWTRSAVVLPDEHLLQPLIEVLPDTIPAVNITMGQPLSATPVFSLIQHLSELQILSEQRDTISFYHKPIMALLYHPYLQTPANKTIIEQMQHGNIIFVSEKYFDDNDLLRQVFRLLQTPQEVLEYLHSLLLAVVGTENEQSLKNECIYQTLLVINRLQNILNNNPDSQLQVKTLFSLLLQLLSQVTIPFEGEPLEGLQVMGVLESRGIDFENLIISSVNDEVLPGSAVQNSFIPYDLRMAYNLPTQERQDAIFAYNFYRLLSGAKRVWLLQNTVSDDRQSGEVSRYVYQLIYQYHLSISKKNIILSPQNNINSSHLIRKTPQVLDKFITRLCPTDEQIRNHQRGIGISPSSVNTYLQCPMRYYLSDICGLREQDKIREDVEMNMFGTILHKMMETLYNFWGHRAVITDKEINYMLHKVRETTFTEQVYKEEFLKSDKAELEGRDYLTIHVLKEFAQKVLEHDRLCCPFTYIASEKDASAKFSVDGHSIYVHGFIDRLDEKDGVMRVIDYKTGKEHSKSVPISQLFTPEAKDSDHLRQTLLYCLMMESETTSPLEPHIYYTNSQDIDLPTLRDKSYAEVKEEFYSSLSALFREMLNPDIPIEARPDSNQHSHCTYCPFTSLCNIIVREE